MFPKGLAIVLLAASGCAGAGTQECLAEPLQLVAPSRPAAPERPAALEQKRKGAGPAMGEGCKSNLMALVAVTGTVARGCLIGHNQWRFWCLDGGTYDDPQSCAKSAPTIQAAEGEGCKSEMLTLVDQDQVWGKGCAIATNQWRLWCSNGKVYEETQPSPPPVGGVGRLCDPALAVKEAAAANHIPGQPAPKGQTVSLTLDQNALEDCVHQIEAQHQCASYLTIKDIRRIESRGETDSPVVVADIAMESIQEFEVRSNTAADCTGTWWKEGTKSTRYQFSFPEAKYFVKVGQRFTIRKTFPFKRNDFGWRCQVQSMKPLDDIFLNDTPAQ
jgi:hypothetical protein